MVTIEKVLALQYLAGHLDELRLHHAESYEHCLRVGQIVLKIGVKLGLSDDDLIDLCAAALLHDLGKSEIEEEILSKNSELTPEERTKIRAHPRLGFIKLNNPKLCAARRIAIKHHEYKLDPYPRSGKKRRNDSRRLRETRRQDDRRIDLLSQIVAIADIFDALSSRRSYKEPLPAAEIRKIIEEQFMGDRSLIPLVLE